MPFAALQFGWYWHIASFRGSAANGRYCGKADIEFKRGAGANAGPMPIGF
jgi:hypothetical protein